MSNMEEVVELFLTWIPSLANLVDISTSTTSENFSVRTINCRRLSIKQKLLLRRRAVAFHFANRHLCNVLFAMDEVTFGPIHHPSPPQSRQLPASLRRPEATTIQPPRSLSVFPVRYLRPPIPPNWHLISGNESNNSNNNSNNGNSASGN